MESIAAAAGWLASEPWLLPPVLALLTHVVCLLCEATRRRTGRAGGHPPPAERPTRDVAAQCGGGPAGAEAAAVHELRVLLLDAQLILPGRYDDDELLRFLQAVKPPLSPLAAFEAVAADVRWRERRRPAKPLGEQLGPPSRRVMLRGLDRHGTPTMLIRPDGDACERPEIFADELLDVLDEHCLSVWRVGGPQRIAIIVDVRAIRPAWLPLAAARELLGTLRAHYPQRAEAIHVVNLPPVLRWGVAAACAMLDSRTAKKVLVHVDTASLGAHFHSSQLPTEYGGTIATVEGGLSRQNSRRYSRDARDTPGRAATSSPGRSLSAAWGARPHTPPPMPPTPPMPTPPTPPRPTPPSRALTNAVSAAPPLTGGKVPRLLWSMMSAEEAALVVRLRQILADRGVVLEPAWRYPDDEMLRVLCDVEPPYDLDEATAACEACVKMRASLPLPVSPSHISEYSKFIRLDGTSRQGEAALVVVVDRALQDRLLADAPPVLLAIYGLLERVRREVFVTGEIETIVTVIDIGRGFRLSWHALPIGPIQQLVAALQDLYPNYSSRILVVNLPTYLMWFLRFVKGLLAEVTANKVQLLAGDDELRRYFDADGMPSIYRGARRADRPLQ